MVVHNDGRTTCEKLADYSVRTQKGTLFSKVSQSNSYISMGKTPWHYHFEADNYLALSQGNSSKLLNDSFIKLSTKIELENWQKLPELSVEYLQKLLQIISD